MSIIEVKNLTKYFKNLKRRQGLKGAFLDLFSRNYEYIKAVDGINISIEAGEIVGFIGPNGAGKSTTIKMLTGVLQASGGTIQVNGFNPFTERRFYVQHIGVVLGQRTQLWWDLPVIETYKLLKEIYQIDDKTYYGNLKIFDDLLGLSDLYLKPVRTLSLGQRILCDIAASFLHDPAVIFLDEPTIGLDISVKQKIRQIIRELNRLKKTTIILTSHDVGDIEELAHRIILIDHGKILYDGDVSHFLGIFGSYRTLRFNSKDISTEEQEQFKEKIKHRFPEIQNSDIHFQKDGWIAIVVNQEFHPLIHVLSFLMEEYHLLDIKVEEIEMEDVIQRVYQGALR
ncbi:MAG: ATP-binding cassette domain-containing protein [Breznakiellaceae bacterium]